ncbi:MAG: hypothetical protein QXR73_00005 [Candidatus Micrarchaeaceae archaeon]
MVATKSRNLWELYEGVDFNSRAYARLEGLWVKEYKLHYSEHYGTVMVLTTYLNYLEPVKSNLLRRGDGDLNIIKKYGNVKLFVNYVNTIDRPTQEMMKALDSKGEAKISINVMLKRNQASGKATHVKLGITDYPFILTSNYPNAMIELTGMKFYEQQRVQLQLLNAIRIG